MRWVLRSARTLPPVTDALLLETREHALHFLQQICLCTPEPPASPKVGCTAGRDGSCNEIQRRGSMSPGEPQRVLWPKTPVWSAPRRASFAVAAGADKTQHGRMTLFGYILTSNTAGTAWENQASFLREWDVRSPACRELGTPEGYRRPGGAPGRPADS